VLSWGLTGSIVLAVGHFISNPRVTGCPSDKASWRTGRREFRKRDSKEEKQGENNLLKD
jgi:hypothetical protein